MATKNAPFYSMKFNRPETVKSHRARQAAIKAAGDFGMIFDTESGNEFQVHAMSDHTMKAFDEGHSSYSEMDFKMKSVLESEKLI